MRDFHLAGRSPVYAANGMAATSMPLATLTALDVLREGGNAVDAAIAAVAVLSVIEPHSTGIGGDCFCLYAPAGQRRVVALNGSGRAPAAAGIDFFEARGISELEATSPHAVTIPGAVGAWEALLAAHGTRGLDAMLQPAIRCAEDGHPVHPRVAHDWAGVADKLRQTGATPFLPGGHAPRAGDRFAQPRLAETLRAIARHGAVAFYEGEIARDMLAALRSRGGLHTEADFAAGRTAAQFVEPIRIGWRDLEVWQCPPNGSGMLVLMLLGILGGFSPDPAGPSGVTRLHRHLEAARLVYRDRNAFLADPEQAEVPVSRLTDDAYLNALRALIRDDRVLPELPPAGGAVWPDHRDTVTLCVVDRDGNACSLINSLFQSFGSGILAPQSGVMLQNRGLGFRLQRGHPNCIAGGKRPLHTIIPGMVTRNGEAIMPYGVMGGHFQPMGQTLFLANHFEYGLDVQAALDLPRVFAYGGQVEVERGVAPDVVDRLTRLGHLCVRAESPLGGGQAISDRPFARRADRRLGPAQGRHGAGLLSAATADKSVERDQRIRIFHPRQGLQFFGHEQPGILLRVEVEFSQQVVLPRRGMQFRQFLDGVCRLTGYPIGLPHLALDHDKDGAHVCSRAVGAQLMPVIAVEVDEQTQARLSKLAQQQACSSLEVVQAAILNHLAAEEDTQASLQEDGALATVSSDGTKPSAMIACSPGLLRKGVRPRRAAELSARSEPSGRGTNDEHDTGKDRHAGAVSGNPQMR